MGECYDVIPEFEIVIELDIGDWDLIWHLTLDIGILFELRIKSLDFIDRE